MNWWQKLFGEKAGAQQAPSGADDATTTVEALAFRITTSGVKPPVGNLDSSQKAWLPKIERARKNAVKFRRDFLADKPFLKDPVDQPMPNRHSLGIVFDCDRMESDYGRQVFEVFFHQLEPSDFQSEVVLHFGDLIQFDAFCALVTRGKQMSDITAIASKFGSDVSAPGLLPHTTRFMMGEKKDGHLIARSFSLPISATVRGNRISSDPQAGVDWMLEAAIEGTKWRM